jgi:transposase
MATASLDDVAVGVYCRERGIYSFQLKQWKETFMTQKVIDKKHAELSELKSLRAENKALKQEIRRKDSALAETTALLVLKKKAALIWGEPEDV